MKLQLSARDRQLQQLKQQQQAQQQLSNSIPVQLQQEEPAPVPPETLPNDVEKLTGALTKEREQRGNAEKQMKLLQQQLKAYEGIDPELARKANEVLQQNQQWEERETKLRAEVGAQYQPKIDDYDRQVKTYQQQLSDTQTALLNYRRDSALERAYLATGGFEGEFEAIAPALRSRTKVNPETGEVEVLGEDGKRLYSKDEPTKPMTVGELIKQLQKEQLWFARHFKGSEGGGMGINGTGRGNPNDPSLAGLNAWDKLAKLREQGKA